MRYHGNPMRIPNMYRKNIGPAPKATKRWHKIVIDIITVLVVVGGLAWFVCSFGM